MQSWRASAVGWALLTLAVSIGGGVAAVPRYERHWVDEVPQAPSARRRVMCTFFDLRPVTVSCSPRRVAAGNDPRRQWMP